MALTWADRLENYRKTLPFPVHMALGPDGYPFGIWNIGNTFSVASGFYGGYPATYLKRVKALFPEKKKVLHLFSGYVDIATFPGVRVDIDESTSPDIVDDAQTLLNVPLEQFDLVLADPPYSIEDAQHYTKSMIKRTKVFRALRRCSVGCHVVWLDQVHIQHTKAHWQSEGAIGIIRSSNHRFRIVTFFRRRQSDLEREAEGL